MDIQEKHEVSEWKRRIQQLRLAIQETKDGNRAVYAKAIRYAQKKISILKGKA